MGEFEELRHELRGLRGDVEGELRALRGEMGTLRLDMETRFARVEAKLDEKPNTATLYQAALTVFAGMFATIAGTVVILKNIGAMP